MGMGVRTQGAAGGLWEAPGAELWLPVPPPPPASPLPSFPSISTPAGEDQSGDQHSQRHGGLCRDGHSAHGFWCH